MSTSKTARSSFQDRDVYKWFKQMKLYRNDQRGFSASSNVSVCLTIGFPICLPVSLPVRFADFLVRFPLRLPVSFL